jgi:hypothetical protein
VGAVLLDPFVPPTPRYYFHYYSQRLLRLKSWLNVASGRHIFWNALKARLISGEAPPPAPAFTMAQTRAFMTNAYQRLLQSDIQLLTITTPGQVRYVRQFVEAFPKVAFGRQLRVEFFGDCDHVFTSEASRARLFRLILQWTECTMFAQRPTESRGKEPDLARRARTLSLVW